VILFIVLVELALFFLDVYYNQTNFNFFQRTGNDDEDPNSIYTDYPPYPDPFISTYRSYQSSNLNISKIVEWISLLNDSYNMADSTVSYFSCQKRAICELWRTENGFKHAEWMNNIFMISDLMNLPDDINYILDELDFARSEAEESEKTCEEMYSYCPSKSIMQIMKSIKKVLR